MLFMVHYEIKPENRDANIRRTKDSGPSTPHKVNVLANYNSVTMLEGWVVVEADDAGQLWKMLQDWTDLNVNHVTPVLDKDAMAKVL